MELNQLTVLPPASLTAQYGVQITGQAMTFPDDMPYAAWADMDKQFDRAEMGLGWWRGDWYNHGEDHYEEFAQVLEVNPAKKRTCQNNGSVCNRYTPEQRLRTGHLLSFSHHAAVAYVDEPLRSKLLHLAVHNQWTCQKLRETLKELTDQKEETEAQDDHDAGEQVNEEYIPVQLPLTVSAAGKLIQDHLDILDYVNLRNWLTAEIGDGVNETPADTDTAGEEPWNIMAGRLMREAIEIGESNILLPASYSQSMHKFIKWIEGLHG